MDTQTEQVKQKVVDVWFDDGNLLVVVGEHKFSIYVGILSAASSVFRDMFQVSEGSQREQIDGRDLVHLTGDSAEDISFLLKAIHDIESVANILPDDTRTNMIST